MPGVECTFLLLLTLLTGKFLLKGTLLITVLLLPVFVEVISGLQLFIFSCCCCCCCLINDAFVVVSLARLLRSRSSRISLVDEDLRISLSLAKLSNVFRGILALFCCGKRSWLRVCLMGRCWCSMELTCQSIIARRNILTK